MNDATSTPNQADVDALRSLLDLMANFESNDQRARYLLSSNWMRDRDAAAPVVDRNALESRLTDALIVADELVAPGYSARIEADADDVARVATDAVLALINGTAS